MIRAEVKKKKGLVKAKVFKLDSIMISKMDLTTYEQ